MSIHLSKSKRKPDEPFFNHAILPIPAALSLGKGARNKSSRLAYHERRWSAPLLLNCHQWLPQEQRIHPHQSIPLCQPL